MQSSGKRVGECEVRGFTLPLSPPETNSTVTVLKNPIPPKACPKTFLSIPSKSFEERLQNYNMKRDEIFNESLSMKSEPKPKVTYKIYGVRQRFKVRRTYLRNISSSKFDNQQDTRRFASVLICDSPIDGLLDSGANITCFGKNGLEFLKENGLTLIPFHASVKTVNGSPAPIIGILKCDVIYQGVKRSLMV